MIPIIRFFLSEFRKPKDPFSVESRILKPFSLTSTLAPILSDIEYNESHAYQPDYLFFNVKNKIWTLKLP